MKLNNTATKILCELPLCFFLCYLQTYSCRFSVFRYHLKAHPNSSKSCDELWMVFSDAAKTLITFFMSVLDSCTEEHAADILNYGLNALRPCAHV